MDKYLHLLTPFFDSGDGGEGGGATPPAQRTYNHDELNGIIGDRLAKERTKIYKLLGVDDEDGLKTMATQLKTLTEENEQLKTQNEQYINEKTLTEKKNQLTEAGIDPDFMDVAIAKWDGKQELTKFVEENPKLTKAYFESQGGDFKGTGTSLDIKGGKTPDITKMTTAEFMEYSRQKDANK